MNCHSKILTIYVFRVLIKAPLPWFVDWIPVNMVSSSISLFQCQVCTDLIPRSFSSVLWTGNGEFGDCYLELQLRKRRFKYPSIRSQSDANSLRSQLSAAQWLLSVSSRSDRSIPNFQFPRYCHSTLGQSELWHLYPPRRWILLCPIFALRRSQFVYLGWARNCRSSWDGHTLQPRLHRNWR